MRSLADFEKKLKITNYNTNPGYNTRNNMKGAFLHSVGCGCQKDTDFLFNQKGKAVPTIHAVVDGYEDFRVAVGVDENRRTYHAGSGSKGNANSDYCGIEMCEPKIAKYKSNSAEFCLSGCVKTRSKCLGCAYINTCSARSEAMNVIGRTYTTAVWYFAYLCTKHGWNPKTCILSHYEGYLKGIATGHVDPSHMWDDIASGLTMDGFRRDVQRVMDGNECLYAGKETSEPAINPDQKIGDTTLGEIAKKIMGEAGVASGRCENMLIAVAQCIRDLSESTGKGLSYTMSVQFQGLSGTYTNDCLKAAYDVFVSGKERFADRSILDIRSFTNYGIDGGGEPNLEKCYTTLDKSHEYLGKDSCVDGSGRTWGHFYFGLPKEPKKQESTPAPAPEPVKAKASYKVLVNGKQVASYDIIENALKDFSGRTEGDVILKKVISG